MNEIEKLAVKVYRSRKNNLTQHEERIEQAVNSVICKIFKIFEVSNDEIPVWKVRIEKSYNPNVLSCLVAFSKNSCEYFYPFIKNKNEYYYNNKKCLKCGDKEFDNIPKTYSKLQSFKNLLLPEDIIVNLYEKLIKMNLPNYHIEKIDDGFEVIMQ